MEASTIFIIITFFIIGLFIIIKSSTSNPPSILQLIIMIFGLAVGHMIVYLTASYYYVQLFAISGGLIIVHAIRIN